MSPDTSPILKPESFYVSPDLQQYEHMKPALKKLNVGDPISNDELMQLHSFLKDLAEKLHALGPHFYLAVNEVEREFRVVEGYRQARIRG